MFKVMRSVEIVGAQVKSPTKYPHIPPLLYNDSLYRGNPSYNTNHQNNQHDIYGSRKKIAVDTYKPRKSTDLSRGDSFNQISLPPLATSPIKKRNERDPKAKRSTRALFGGK